MGRKKEDPRNVRLFLAFSNQISAGEMGKSYNKAADLIRETTNYTL